MILGALVHNDPITGEVFKVPVHLDYIQCGQRTATFNISEGLGGDLYTQYERLMYQSPQSPPDPGYLQVGYEKVQKYVQPTAPPHNFPPSSISLYRTDLQVAGRWPVRVDKGEKRGYGELCEICPKQVQCAMGEQHNFGIAEYNEAVSRFAKANQAAMLDSAGVPAEGEAHGQATQETDGPPRPSSEVP